MRMRKDDLDDALARCGEQEDGRVNYPLVRVYGREHLLVGHSNISGYVRVRPNYSGMPASGQYRTVPRSCVHYI